MTNKTEKLAASAQADTNAPAAADTEPADIKSSLDLAWVKIQTGLKRMKDGHNLWIAGTLELIKIFDDARKRLGSDQAFGKWLTDNGYGEDRITRHDRSALLNMALNLNITYLALAQTHRSSWRHIWEKEVQPRLPHTGQPADGKSTKEVPADQPDGESTKEARAVTRRPKKNGRTETGKQGAEARSTPEHRRLVRRSSRSRQCCHQRAQ